MRAQTKRKIVAMLASLATLGVGAVSATGATAVDADANNAVVVTPNPWYANGPFNGWGTSLAWLANATGNYGEEGSITNAGDVSDEAYAKALEYGKQLREEFYQSIFGEDGLDLNMARFNIGGGNASDVAYGYPFMRQGANVPGYWADDADGTNGTYDGVTTTQADKEAFDAAFDPTDDSNYDWSKGAAQEWWLEHGLETGDIDHVETFANSAPWFMTESGYATGNYSSGSDNVADPEKFAQYMAAVTKHLEETYNFNVDTVEPFNESETSYWGTTSGKADSHPTGSSTDSAGIDEEIFNYYWDTYYSDKNQSVTPYAWDLKKPQEGMHVDNDTQQAVIAALSAALADDEDTVVAATDATDSGHFVESYNQYTQDIKDSVGQYNTHSYGTTNQRVARDIAQTDGKVMSQSEVDGSWQSGGFNPYNFDNGLGMAGKINSDVYTLQSQDFTFWQVVEDLYNMATGDTDINGNAAEVKGENTNWGTVFIDFDCTIAGDDGQLYSERAWLNNGKSTEGIASCSVLANSKYNAVRAYTKFIHEGDSITANNRTSDTMTAASADGKTQTVIHTNSSSKDQTFVIDLSKYGDIAENASGTLYLTTEPDSQDSVLGATIDYMNQFSNVEQDAGSVVIDREAKTATVTVPARSIASIQLTGVTGVADDAAIQDGGTYQLVGVSSNKPLTEKTSGDSALSLQDSATTQDEAKAQAWTFHEVQAPADRPTLRRYVITDADGKVLIAQNDTNALSDMSVEEAKTNDAAIWVLNTEDGESYSLVNVEDQKAMDVNGQGTSAGTKVGLWQSGGGDHQAWYIRSTEALGAVDVSVQTAVGTMPTLPETITPYYSWGEGDPVSVVWNTDKLADQVKTAGTYTVTGTATDLFGNELTVTATVYAGAFTVTDPVSITVGVGSSLAEVQKQAPSVVSAHVGDSDAFDADVTWDWESVSDDTFSQSGKVTVTGSVSDSDGSGTLPATLTIYVTETGKGSNVINCSSMKASSEQGSDEWGPYPATNTCDGDLSTYWSTWHNGSEDTDPWLSYTFDEPTKLWGMDFYPEQGTNEGPLSKITVLYLADDGETWTESGLTLEPDQDSASGKGPYYLDLSSLPATAGIKLDLDYGSVASQSTFTKVAEVKIYASEPAAASDDTLDDLRIDGASIEGFDPQTNTYTAALPELAESYPVISAYATDSAASVDVKQATRDNGGKATVTVTSADGSSSDTYTVEFTGDLVSLDGLRVVPPTKTDYKVGESFDSTGMQVFAQYMPQRDDATENDVIEREIQLDDDDLAVTGFDSVAAGSKTVTVSYRGVSATFTVNVAAVETPGSGDDSGSQSGDGSGAQSGGNGTASADGQSGSMADTGASVLLPIVVAVLLAVTSAAVIATRNRWPHRG